MKTFKKIMSNQSGMSLIEVIVAAAISVIISGAVMKTNETGIKGMNSVSSKINLDMWKSTVLTAKFNDPAVCKANFDSLGWTPGGGVPAAATLFNEDGSVFLNGNDTINGTQGDWKFIGVTVNPFSADPGATTKGNCNVKVTVENNKSKMSFGTKQKVITIPIRCNLDSGATTLVSCSGSSDGMDSLWIQQLAGTNPGYIYRSDNVLIGPAGQVVDTPFQINMESPIEWPASGSGVRASMRITGDDAVVGQPAMIFNQSGLYEDASGCLITAVDNGVGNIFEASKACNGSFAIGSFSSMTINPSPGGRTNVAIASGGSTVDGHWSTVISSEGSTASGDLTMALGSRSSLATGSLSSVISANGSMAYPSRASGVGSVVLGASNVHVGGDYSIGLGIKNIITGNRSVTIGDSLIQAGDNSLSVGYSLANSGQNSITFGSRNSNSFANSVIGGFQSNITGTGGNSLVVSWKSDIKDSYHMTTLGANNYVNCSYCGAYGTDIDIRHDDSFVMGSWRTSNRALNSTMTNQITMGAKNGFRFFTDGFSTSSASAEHTAMYIDDEGRVGMGKDLQNVAVTEFIGGFEKPRLYVKGKAEFHHTSSSSASYAPQATIYARNNPYDQATGKFFGIYAKVSSNATTHNGYHYGILGNASNTNANSSGRSYGVWGQAGNAHPGYNYGIYGMLTGSNNGVGVFGTLEGDVQVSSAYAGYFNGKVKMTTRSTSLSEGTNWTQINGSTTTTSSDRRAKDDIQTVGKSLDKLLKLEGVSYYYKDRRHNKRDFGFIAQDVEKVLPDLVHEEENGKIKDFKSINYNGFFPFIVNATKELFNKFMSMFNQHDDRIKKLEEQNKKLEKQIAEQNKLLLEIKQQMNREIASAKDKK